METRLNYFKNIFRDIENGEHIAIAYNTKKNYQIGERQYFKSVEEAEKYILKRLKYKYWFYIPSLTDGKESSEAHLTSTSALVFDFDKKLGCGYENVQLFAHKIRSHFNIFINSIIDTGGGYHVAIFIEKTTEMKRVKCVYRKLQKIWSDFGCDSRACKPTQPMRCPGAMNPKHNKPVNCLYIKTDHISTLEEIEKKISNFEKYGPSFNRVIKPCIQNMLEQGAEVGDRNTCLGRIVCELKQLGYSFAEIEELAQKFNSRCSSQKSANIINHDTFRFYNMDYKLYGCRVYDDRIQNIINKYCDKKLCSERIKRATGSSMIKTAPIPSSFVSKEMLSEFNGYELAILIFCFQKNKKTINDIVELGISESAARRYLNHLIANGKIKKYKQYYKVTKYDTNTIDIHFDFVSMALGKKITSAEASIYLVIAFFNASNIYPTNLMVANVLNKNYSNVTKNIQKLQSQGIILVQKSAKGLGEVNHLIAV